jgi:hypothetical protein
MAKQKRLSKKVKQALERGRVLKGKNKSMNIIIGKGTDSLEKFIRGGPRGEAAQDAFDRDFDREYGGY